MSTYPAMTQPSRVLVDRMHTMGTKTPAILSAKFWMGACRHGKKMMLMKMVARMFTKMMIKFIIEVMMTLTMRVIIIMVMEIMMKTMMMMMIFLLQHHPLPHHASLQVFFFPHFFIKIFLGVVWWFGGKHWNSCWNLCCCFFVHLQNNVVSCFPFFSTY